MKKPDGWEEVPVYRGGQKAAFFLVNGNEIHCLRLDSFNGRWLTRQDLENLTRPIFEKFGHLTTRVRKSNRDGQRFVQRLGFYQISEDENEIFYRAERLNHARN